MNTLVCVVVLGAALSQASRPRSVNLALETVLEFDNNDDVDFIDTLQAFLNNIKTTVVRNRATDEHNKGIADDDASDKKILKLTEFLAEIVNTLKTYKDDDLKEFIRSLDVEIEIRQKDNRFQQIADAIGLRRSVSRKLKELKNSPVRVIRKKLNSISRKLRVNEHYANGSFMGDFLNNFYRQQSQHRLSRFLNNLKLYRTRARRSFNLDLKTIIQNGIQALLDPMLNLKTNSNGKRNKTHSNDISVNSKTKQNDNSAAQFSRQKIGKQTYMTATDVQDDNILDYIDDHKSVIEKHISTKDHLTTREENLKNEAYRTAVTRKHNHIKTGKRKRKSKSKYNKRRHTVKVEEKSDEQKHVTVKTKYAKYAIRNSNKQRKLKADMNKHGNIDLSELDEPILMTIGSSDESDLHTDYDYESTTQRTKQTRFKKFTRRPTTEKAFVRVKTTKEAHELFMLPVHSDRGMPIEQFGSFVDIKSMRKNNDYDKVTQTDVNITLPYEEEQLPTLMRRNKDSSRKTEKYKTVDKVTKRVERKAKHKTSDAGVISENIRLTGDIMFEATAKDNQVNKNSESILSKLKIVDESPKTVQLNATRLTTRNFNFIEMKPTTVVKTQKSNEVELSHTTSIDKNIFTATSVTTTDNKTAIKTEKMQVKASEDDFENELENMIDRFNKSSNIPAEMEHFLKESEKNNPDKNNNDIQKQMKSDFEKVFGPTTPPSSKSTVTELFTDPFRDIDEAFDHY